jgi:hypothetical protein
MNFKSNHPARAVMHSVAFAAFLTAGAALAATPALAAWDSIAVDDDTDTKAGQAGYGVGQGPTKSEAEHQAMKACKGEGNSGCQIEISYKDTCGAYASSKKYSGHATGASKHEAAEAAVSACGDSSCKLVVSDCVGQD